MTETFDRLVMAIARLPGIGRRSAERMATKLVQDPNGMLSGLVQALQDAGRELCACSRCGSLTAKAADPCRLCTDPSRDASLLCVVEDPSDIAAIERAGGYRGRYHALMGRLSPMRGAGPNELRLKALLKRVSEADVKEVILALSTDMEGDSTAALVKEHLAGAGVAVSRLAYGLPAGSGIMYSDPITLQRAMRGRTPDE